MIEKTQVFRQMDAVYVGDNEKSSRALIIAARVIEDGDLGEFIDIRYNQDKPHRRPIFPRHRVRRRQKDWSAHEYVPRRQRDEQQ